MKKNYTPFWQAWKETCSATICRNPKQLEVLNIKDLDACEVASLANDVAASLDNDFKRQLDRLCSRGDCTSPYRAANGGLTDSAFEVLEGTLYEKQKIRGVPFKQYLYGQIGIDGVNAYLRRTLARIAGRTLSKGARKDVPQTAAESDETTGLALEELASTATRSGEDDLEPVELEEVRDTLRQFQRYLQDLPKDESDLWVVLYSMFFLIPIANPQVVSLCRRKKSQLSEMQKNQQEKMRRLLREGVSERALALVCRRCAGALRKQMADMPVLKQLETIAQSRF
ncbi:MAG: hypothetical protein ACI4X9_00075 [Kiritimatiellia bacterium]